MMWDLGGQQYIPGSSPPPQQSSYPPYPQEPAPFAPLAQPMPQLSSPDYYGAPSGYGGHYPGPPVMPRAISEPAQFSGATIARSPAPVIHHAQSSHSTRTTHVHIRSSHHHSQYHTRPHRASDAQAHPPPHKLTHQPAAARPHTNVSAAPHHHAQVWGYSKCTGRKKALCIGINYTGTQHELHGCINDAKNVRDFLIRHWGYKAEDIVLLTDDSPNPRSVPTRANMLDAMRWLVKDSNQHDSLFFHYSGHGSQVKDRDGDEKDGMDEVVLPVDFARAGYISDDLMHEIMVRKLPLGCRLTALFDSCHSGSALDLPYLYNTSGRVKGSQVSDAFYSRRATPADVISFSGCRDNQTSADTYESGVAVGAMSHAFMTSMRNTPVQTYQELLRSVRKILRDKYDQKPQLSASHRIDTGLQFIL